MIGGGKCGGCGYELQPGRHARPVIAQDGTLREQEGKAFQPHRISKKPNGPALWKRMYWRSRSGKGERTFRAASALFAQENEYGWPDPAWPYMPRESEDHFRLVGDVPLQRLVGYCGVCASLPCHCAERLP